MLLAAREKDGPDNRRGCIALITSPDLERWSVQAPFWSPRLYYTHECPDLFRWGDQWVLVYSTFSERHVTHFRVSDSLSGPWHAPLNDSFDGRAFYAAKTASDGQRRFVFGWNPTREGETDTGRWQWAGRMVVHELNDDLSVRPVPEQVGRFSSTQETAFQSVLGEWTVQGDAFSSTPSDGFAVARLGDLPDTALLSCTITCHDDTRACGLLLRADPKLDHYYQLRWEPGQSRLVMDRWPRPGDEPFMLERPLTRADRLRLRVFVEGTVIVVYANDEIALSSRTYDHRQSAWGLFVSEGQATFSDVSVNVIG
jgi:beta-fructofuranosidase